MTLRETLLGMNTADSNWGLWVNPENIDEFRRGQFVAENGGVSDNWICIGDLGSISFGYQSESDAFYSWVSGGQSTNETSAITVIDYGGKKVRINPEAVYESYCGDRTPALSADFKEFIGQQILQIQSAWAEAEVDEFLGVFLPKCFENHQESERLAQEIYAWTETL